MNKLKLHIYGKYMGDIKVIHDVLEESSEYDMTYQYIDIGKGGRPSEIDYLIRSHQAPNWYKGKIIHAFHGLGFIPLFPNLPMSELLALYKKQNHALCVYGKLHKSWFEDIGFASEKILTIGMAASVYLLSPINMGEREKFFYKKGLNPDKETIIYAPSWDHNEERGFFVSWWQDKKEGERVEKFCKFITYDLKMNLIVRLHERHRYSQDWIKEYGRIFDTYRVNAHYINQDPYNLPYLKFSDVLVGDISSLNICFYVMDKPVIHIGASPIKKKRQSRWGVIALSERAGYVVEDFQDLLDKLKDSVANPSRFSVDRKKTVGKYIDYTGEDSREAMLGEFRRLLHDER